MVTPPDTGLPFGDGSLTEGFAVGNYYAQYQFQAQTSEQEPFSPGVYGLFAGNYVDIAYT